LGQSPLRARRIGRLRQRLASIVPCIDYGRERAALAPATLQSENSVGASYHRAMDSAGRNPLTMSPLQEGNGSLDMRAGNPVGTVLPHGPVKAPLTPAAVWVSRTSFTAVYVMDSQARLRSLIRQALNLLERDAPEAWRYLRDACTLLDQEIAGESIAGQVAHTVQPGCLAAWQAQRVVDHIEGNLGTKLTIAAIAAPTGLSKSHFCRVFKTTLGTSPMAYVVARRIERAKCMILSSVESLAEVALNCGFADQSHLNRQFRRVVGVTPGRWRRLSEPASGAMQSDGRSVCLQAPQMRAFAQTAAN
jgi:AraC family transcriptional regulator